MSAETRDVFLCHSSEDKKTVVAQSMGWCNNPDSPNYQKLTMADHQMKKVGVWKKWHVIKNIFVMKRFCN